MRKKIFIALLLGTVNTLIFNEETTKLLQKITKEAKVSKIPINEEALQKDREERFQTEFVQFQNEYKPIYGFLESLNNALNAYNKQSVEYQKNYRNVAPFDTLINQIKQKQFIIETAKLLQYVTFQNNPTQAQANLLIKNLKNTIKNITTTLTMLSKNKDLFVPFVDNPPAKIAQTTIADYFKNYTLKQFFLKIKKIRRSIINWEIKFNDLPQNH